MSIRIISSGILDTIQDTGRYGYQHLGIGEGGAMDRFSACLANALLGRELHAPVLELHFPAASLLFEKPTVLAITGADFSPVINNKPVPSGHPIVVPENSLLQFRSWKNGARVYISMFQQPDIEPWLNSFSTHTRAGAGGLHGRKLERYDCIPYKNEKQITRLLHEEEVLVLPWKSHESIHQGNEVECIIGNEWNWMDERSQNEFQEHWYQVGLQSDRMGYHLSGYLLHTKSERQMISAPACAGTIQLLPDGNLIVLMADHQTTGGYPRIAHVITADIPLLAQKKMNEVMRFRITDLQSAEDKFLGQEKYLGELQIACKFRMQNLFDAGM